MWCLRPGVQGNEKLHDYITYFEGTCEFCIGNMGINQYLSEIKKTIEAPEKNDDEGNMLSFYIYGLIQYKLENLEEAVEAWKKSEMYAEKMDNKVFLAKIYSYYAIYYYVKDNKPLSTEFFNKAKQILDAKRLYTELALHYINFLWYKRYDENKDEVAEYLDAAFYYVQLSDSVMDARIYLHLGYIYKTVFNDFLRGFNYLSTARDLCYQSNNVEMESMTLHVLADGYMQLSHYEEAIKIYEVLMNDSRYERITETLKCMILSNLIPCYLTIKDYSKVQAYLWRMEGLVTETQTNVRIQFETILSWLKAQLYIISGQKFDEVLSLLTTCSEIYEQNKMNFQIEAFDCKLENNFGDFYVKQKLFDKAIEHYLKQRELAEKRGGFYLKEALGNLAEVYALSGNYQEALKYRKEEADLFDEIENSNILAKYDRLYKKYYKKLQDKQILNLKQEHEKLEKDTFVDELTNVYNKAFLLHYCELVKDEKQFASIMIDIDNFKKYNDAYGHPKGDVCLSTVAGIIKADLPENGVLIRYGGEEFLVIIENYSEKQIIELSRKMISDVNEAKIKHEYSGKPPYLTISAGCSTGNASSREELEDIVNKADKGLYIVKKQGKNEAYFYE